MTMLVTQKVAIGLLLFTGVSAVAAGASLVADPSGGGLQMPLSLLAHSPFPDFFIPGLVLLMVIGVGSLGAAIGVWQQWRKAPLMTFIEGIMLLGWIIFQVIWIGLMSWLQPVVAVISITLIGLGQSLLMQQK